MIKYIGSKRLLVPLITKVIGAIAPSGSVIDLFSGTSRVGHALKAANYQVFANDLNSYAATLARCYVQADLEEIEAEALRLIAEMNRLEGRVGYFTRTFCEESRYFQPKNGARVDAMRDWIASAQLGPELEAVLLVSLMEAADRVDSTTGLQMAYLKKWAPRAHNDIELRMPKLFRRAASGKGRATQFEAQEAAATLTGDVGYLDPPYNQHKYLGNYHIWETLVRWDAPESYGIARKRIDCRERKSAFNSKPRIHAAMAGVVEQLDVRNLVVSFSNEGYIQRDAMLEILSRRGEVFVLERDFKRYVGAQIGIYNPSGNKVGRVSHLSNKEYLFVVPEHPDKIRLPRDVLRPAGETFSRPSQLPLPTAAQESSVPAPSPGTQRTLLIATLKSRGSISSRDAQQAVDSTATEVRRVFRSLLADGLIFKTGSRRGTVYHWKERVRNVDGDDGSAFPPAKGGAGKLGPGHQTELEL